MSTTLAPADEPPLAPAPPGQVTDFADAGFAPTLRALIIVLLVLNTAFTVARVYTRAIPLRRFGVDDGKSLSPVRATFVVAAWICTSVHMAVTLDALNHGFGRHLWDIRVSGYRHLYLDFFVLEVWSTVVYLSLKIAYLATYLRIFELITLYRWAIWGGIVVCTLFYVGSFWWLNFKCSPIAASWDPTITNATCANEFVPGGETGVFNVISDIYILVLPIPMVWNLRLNVRRRIRLMAAFSAGVFTVATSVVRLAETVIQAKNPDAFYALGKVDIWALLEYSVGLMVVCSLVFGALWNTVLAQPVAKTWSSMSSAAKSALTFRPRHADHSQQSQRSQSSQHHLMNIPASEGGASSQATPSAAGSVTMSEEAKLARNTVASGERQQGAFLP